MVPKIYWDLSTLENLSSVQTKIMIKANQIDMDALLISEVDNIQDHVCP